MEFCIAGIFTASLAKLTGDEQKAVKTTAFDLQITWRGGESSFTKSRKGPRLVYGVPSACLDEVLQANEESILGLLEHLPSEAKPSHWGPHSRLSPARISLIIPTLSVVSV